MSDVTNEAIRNLDNALSKLTDLADAAIVEARRWALCAEQARTSAYAKMEERSEMIRACADMAAVNLRLAEFHQTNYINARHERNQEVIFERARQAGLRDKEAPEEVREDGDVELC